MMWVAGDVSYHLIHDNVIHSWYFFDHIKSNKNDMWQKHCVCSESRFQHCNSMTLKLIFSWFPLGGEKNVSQTRWNTPNGQIWTNTPWSAHAALIWFWEYKTSSQKCLENIQRFRSGSATYIGTHANAHRIEKGRGARAVKTWEIKKKEKTNKHWGFVLMWPV